MSIGEKIKRNVQEIAVGVVADPRTAKFVDDILVGKVFPFIQTTALSVAETFSEKIINRVLDLDQDGKVDALEVIERVDQAVDQLVPKPLQDLLNRTGLNGIFTDWITPKRL